MSVFFFSTLSNCKIQNSKNYIFGSKTIIPRNLGIKRRVKTHFMPL